MTAGPAGADPLAGFHPTVAHWFRETLGEPTEAQRRGWPAIRAGQHVLVAAPTGTGKTLAAFLWALDGLLRRGAELPDRTEVLYVSPLRALSHDVQKNLSAPLAELAARDPALPEVRVAVRTGDTPAAARAAMVRRAPHVLVTTPESLYILLTSASGRRQLSSVRTVIVDEIHALARDRRGSHLALSLERLSALVDGPLQRIGLSATQRPLEDVARLLVGVDRPCELVDAGHLRELDVDVLLPDTPLAAVCSHEQWGELHARLAAIVREHRTTLVFVNTRKLAERLAARLTEQLGAGAVGCHHGSLSRELRLDAEERLKTGKLSVLVATASLELGLDIGDVDLVVQIGSSRAIATALQRIGRAGHGVRRLPKGRLVPLTVDEGVEACALLSALAEGELDRTPSPPAALDILVQQVVAECVTGEQDKTALFERLRRAWPYRELLREDFDTTVALHLGGRFALLHEDGVAGRLLATRRARLVALTGGGAIPDNTDYRVLVEPEGTFVGTLNEDFAIEANVRDIFQLGNASWQILRVEPGIVRVADAAGQPPTLPFWTGEAPARTRELSQRIGELREDVAAAMADAVAAGHGAPLSTAVLSAGAELIVQRTRVGRGAGVDRALAEQVALHVAEGFAELGAVPSQRRVVLERFFDESGGMQLVVHAPFGGRINRAWGLALRKRFCRGFGFELQAAANEEAIVLSLGPQQSFPLADVFNYLHPAGTRQLLIQAALAAPMFATRWRWNVVRSLLLARLRGGKPVPAALQRMRADDLLVAAFPAAQACPETLPAGDIPVPMEHPVVRQTVEDCLHEAMDLDGLLAVLTELHDGRIERVAVDTPTPSAFALGILAAQPYAFLDDAPLEERRTQAVLSRRSLPRREQDGLGALDPAAVADVVAQAWPDPRDAEELHEALTWMGFVTEREATASGWATWLASLRSARRVVERSGADGARHFAVEAPAEGVAVLRGRLEALGPVAADAPLIAEFGTAILELEAAGVVLRTRLAGRDHWCVRHLLARIQRATVATLRQQIEPVSWADFLRFLGVWQHTSEGHRLTGPRGVFEVLRQLAGWQAPAGIWEARLLPARITGYRQAWLDELGHSGELVWGRLWGAGALAPRSTPVALLPREDAAAWLGLSTPGDSWSLKGPAREVHAALLQRGPSFLPELVRETRQLPAQVEAGLADLVGLGLLTCDAWAGLRALMRRPDERRLRARRGSPPAAAGRWSLWRGAELPAPPAPEHLVDVLLARWGVLTRRVLLREKLPWNWRTLLAVLRQREARGELRGGRFVAGVPGEQYALPAAIERLRECRNRPGLPLPDPGPGDPLEAIGTLACTPADALLPR